MTRWLTSPQSALPLGLFRLVLGAYIACWSAQSLLLGWVELRHIATTFHISYPWFPSVPTLPSALYVALYGLIFLFGIGLSSGLFFRLSCAVTGFGIGFLMFQDMLLYSDHHYLLILFIGLISLTDAHTCLTLSARKQDSIPAWQPLLLKLQVAMVILFSIINKGVMNWFDSPLLISYVERFFQGHSWLLSILNSPSFLFIFKIDMILIELGCLLFLFSKAYRNTAVVCLSALQLVLYLLFYRLNETPQNGALPVLILLGACVFLDLKPLLKTLNNTIQPISLPVKTSFNVSKGLLVALLLFGGIQLLIPLRAYLYPNAHWSGRGTLFAWRSPLNHYAFRGPLVVLNTKTSSYDYYHFQNEFPYMNTADRLFPFTLHYYAGILTERYKQQGIPYPHITSAVELSLNETPYAPHINPHMNLASASWSHSWVLPQPYPRQVLTP